MQRGKETGEKVWLSNEHFILEFSSSLGSSPLTSVCWCLDLMGHSAQHLPAAFLVNTYVTIDSLPQTLREISVQRDGHSELTPENTLCSLLVK